MSSKLRNFLGLKLVKSGAFTHTIKPCPFSRAGFKFLINTKDDQKVFIKHYCKYIKDGREPISLAERPEEYTPFRADFDFVYSDEGKKGRRYTHEFLIKLASVYQEIILDVFDISDEGFENCLDCIFLEKPFPIKTKSGVKDGFHLQFPKLICDKWTMNYIRRRALDATTNLWEELGVITPVKQIIDDIASHVWLMYGSVNYKSDKSRPYIYSRDVQKLGVIFNRYSEELTLEELFEEQLSNCDVSAEELLPQLLSIQGFNEEDAIPLSERTLKYKRKQREQPQVVRKRRDSEIAEDLAFIRDNDLLSLLSQERKDYEPKWFEVGRILFNISEGHSDALDLWIEFSKGSDSFEDGACEKKWSRMKIYPNITMRSLMSMVKFDSPGALDHLIINSVEALIEKSLTTKNPTHGGVAAVVYLLTQGKIVHTSSRKKSSLWFEFKNHRWIKMDTDASIYKVIVEDVKSRYALYKVKLTKGQVNKTGDNRSSLQEKIDKCTKIIESLEMAPFVNGVIRFCKYMFTDREFLDKIDENRNLIGCENGVLDFEYGGFREGRPDDYITFSTFIHYKEYEEDDPDYILAMEFFEKMFVNEKLRKYNFDFFARALRGKNSHKLFLTLTGTVGNNAKTSYCHILEKALGKYIGKFPRETILKSRSQPAGGPRPDLARVKGKRIMVVDETTASEVMDVGMLKLLTGNDSFYGRTLYDDPEDEIRPMFTLVSYTNAPASVPESDLPYWERVRLLPCESRFIKPIDIAKVSVPETKEEQFKKKIFHADLNFDEKIPRIAPVMLYILFKTAVQAESDCIEEPEEIKISTSNYRKSNDVYEQFISDKLFSVSEANASKYVITQAKMVQAFISWFAINYKGLKHESKENIKKNIIEKTKFDKKRGIGFRKSKGKWFGYSLYPLDDSSDDEKEKKIDIEEPSDEEEKGDEAEEEDVEEIKVFS